MPLGQRKAPPAQLIRSSIRSTEAIERNADMVYHLTSGHARRNRLTDAPVSTSDQALDLSPLPTAPEAA